MEWLLGSVLIPIIVWLYTIYRDRKKDYDRNESRFYDLESRVTVAETQIETLERDVSEIQKLSNKIEQIQMDLVRVLTLLEERTTKGP
jgi:peptidoglycan hydrolase CwlO-like protein